MFLADSKPDNEDNCYCEDCTEDCDKSNNTVRNIFTSIIYTLNLIPLPAPEMATSLILLIFIMAFIITLSAINNDKLIVGLSCRLIMLNGIF